MPTQTMNIFECLTIGRVVSRPPNLGNVGVTRDLARSSSRASLLAKSCGREVVQEGHDGVQAWLQLGRRQPLTSEAILLLRAAGDSRVRLVSSVGKSREADAQEGDRVKAGHCLAVEQRANYRMLREEANQSWGNRRGSSSYVSVSAGSRSA